MKIDDKKETKKTTRKEAKEEALIKKENEEKGIGEKITEIPKSFNSFNEALEILKQTYKKLYLASFNGQDIIWRPIVRSEYKMIEKTDNELDVYAREENICKRFILYPSTEIIEDLIENNAGFATSLSEQILIGSGFAIRSLPIS